VDHPEERASDLLSADATCGLEAVCGGLVGEAEIAQNIPSGGLLYALSAAVGAKNGASRTLPVVAKAGYRPTGNLV
jgi:hypothetical protein